MLMEKSCGAVVFTKNGDLKYLLLHYGAGHWGFVKGHIEPNETEKQTAKRELKEETKITKAEFVENFKEEIEYFFKRNGKTINKKVTYFLIQTKEKKVELSHEHKGYRWLNYENALKQLTFKNARKVLKKSHTLLKTLGFN